MGDDEPKYIGGPDPPKSMNIFKWDDPELQKWVQSAIQMQNQHVIDNNNTEHFKFKHSQIDAIQLRICIILFGIKVNLLSFGFLTTRSMKMFILR